MKKITVLGAGMVGSAIAADLSGDYEVTLCDLSEERLARISSKTNITTRKVDLSDNEHLREAVAGADIVAGAVPGFMGFQTLKTIIEEGKDVVDISFFNEDPFLLDDYAKKNNVTAVVDCGVAPGLSNIILGYYNAKMKLDSFECLVGGLPLERKWPFEYKAPFSPPDVIEEYTRPARIKEKGKVLTKPALSDPELIETEAGTLEAFNTDGLRSLLTTIDIPDMKEKTLRYPGHIELMRVLRETGFFSKEEIDIGGKKVRPLDLSSRLLFPLWKLDEGEEEFTYFRTIIKGEGKKFELSLFDKYDKETNTSSMARTTGYTCTAAVNLVLKGSYKRKGISPPEYIGSEGNCFDEVLKYLAERNINILRK